MAASDYSTDASLLKFGSSMGISQSDYVAMLARTQSRKEAPTSGGEKNEAHLHELIFAECQRRGWIALHGSMAERTHRTAGEPDFVCIADGGRVLFIECKSRTGKLSAAQFALKFHAEKLGHTIHVVRSFEQFLEVITR